MTLQTQYIEVHRRYPLWTRRMVLHYLAGWNGVTFGVVCASLLAEGSRKEDRSAAV